MPAATPSPPNAPAGTWYKSPAAGEASKLVVTSPLTGKPGMLHWVSAHNTSGSTLYLFVFDGTTASGTLLVGPLTCAANADISWDCRFAKPFSTGLFVAFSTSDSTYSVAGSTPGIFEVGYHATVPEGSD